MSAGCRLVFYCNATCQRAAWKGHKAECKRARQTNGAKKTPRRLPLTWAQLEDTGPDVPATGKTLEVSAVLDESVIPGVLRQVMQCKDRVGELRRVAAYTSGKVIPRLAPGNVMRWKNPRFHYFLDGSSGARIEDEDLPNITVSNN